MCKACRIRGRKEFWLIDRFVGMDNFEREQEVYKERILSLMEKTTRTIHAVDCLKGKCQFNVEIYQLLSDGSFLILFSQNHITALCNVIMRDRYFWNHKIWPGLHFFVRTIDGLVARRSKIACDLEENIDKIYCGKLS